MNTSERYAQRLAETFKPDPGFKGLVYDKDTEDAKNLRHNEWHEENKDVFGPHEPVEYPQRFPDEDRRNRLRDLLDRIG